MGGTATGVAAVGEGVCDAGANCISGYIIGSSLRRCDGWLMVWSNGYSRSLLIISLLSPA